MSEAFCPALTTIALPRRKIGFSAAEMLVASIKDAQTAPRDSSDTTSAGSIPPGTS